MTVFHTATMRARCLQFVCDSSTQDDNNPTTQSQLRIGTGDPSQRNVPSSVYPGGRQGRLRRGNTAAQATKQAITDLNTWLEMSDTALSEPNEKGYNYMHRSAERGYVQIFEKAATVNKQLLESKTFDGSGMTPLLVAVQVNRMTSHLAHRIGVRIVFDARRKIVNSNNIKLNSCF